MPASGSLLSLSVPSDFLLPAAVCSYGYFILAPNRWDPDTQALIRPMRGRRERILWVRVTQSGDRLRIRCDKKLHPDERATVKRQLTRMLRINEDLRAWHRIDRKAKRRKFGRLFRSPTLFEDIVKTITTCNVAWPNTIRMNQLLCSEVGGGGFPTPKQCAAMRPSVMQKRCKVGYRAERIVKLAREIESGKRDIDALENPTLDKDEVYDRLRAIYGIGDYAASNLCQLLGHYDRLAIDSETYRHFCDVHKAKRPDNPAKLESRIRKHYDQFAPYQFLAYWFELWGAYEKHVGHRSEQWSDEHAGAFTASQFAK